MKIKTVFLEVKLNKLNQLENKKGFTLIELLVAFAFFSIIIGGVVLLSIRAIEANQKAQALQGALENSRFAIESLSKKIRTSGFIKSASEGEIFLIDNLDGSKYCYRFGTYSGKKSLLVAKSGSSSTATSCSGMSGFLPVIYNDSVDIEGKFIVKESNLTASTKKRGLVRIVVELKYKDTSSSVTEKDKITIQSTVSLRDY